MPRVVKPSPDRWLHPWYRYAYCYPKRGVVYTCVNSFRQSTALAWEPKNRDRAIAILSRRIEDQYSPKSPARTELKTINDLARLFNQVVIQKQSKATRAQYRVAFKRYLTHDYRLDQVDEIKDMILGNYQNSGVADNTNWKRLQRIRKLFEFAVQEGWADRNPVSRQMVPKYQSKPVRTFTNDEIKAILKALQGNTELKHFVCFALRTGARIGELIELKWHDIKPEYIQIKGKTGFRIFPLKPFPALRRQIDAMRDPVKHSKVFSWLNQQNPARQFRSLLRELGIEGKSFHTLRKTTINNWRLKGYDIELRTALAGHDEATQKGFYLDSPNIEYFNSKFERIGEK